MHPFLGDLLHLGFPRYCSGCGRSLFLKEICLCMPCLIQLPKTTFHSERENIIERLFWGKCDIHLATAFLHMTRRSTVRHMIHELKYEGNDKIGIYLGKLFGHELRKHEEWRTVDFIVPVPLHPKKEKKRGYNQSQKIALGMSESMRIPYRAHALRRSANNASQTRKSRIDRWDNVETAFEADSMIFQRYSHVLIVDDVITTGATIEACAVAIQKVASCKISVATLARPTR